MAWEVVHKVQLTETHWTVEDWGLDLMYMDNSGTRPIRFSNHVGAKATADRLNRQRGIYP